MIKISEWLPNPYGQDSENEWVELYNLSSQEINLDGWTIVSSNKIYKIKNKTIEPNSFLILHRKETGISLLNQNGELKIFDYSKKLVDSAKFFGKAPEGKSFARVGDTFLFSVPTPGKENVQIPMALIVKNYPENTPLNTSYIKESFWSSAILVGILLSLTFWFIIKKNESLKKLFFE